MIVIFLTVLMVGVLVGALLGLGLFIYMLSGQKKPSK